MSCSATIFAQIMAGLQPGEFARCVEAFPAPRSARSFGAYDHFLSQCFGQLTYRESGRDIVSCLNARAALLYHMGFRGRLTRTNFAYANTHRDWRIFAAVADILCRRARRLYQKDSLDPDLPLVAYALDASIIHLSLQLFPWAYWGRSRAGALKLHTLLALQGSLPVWAAITEAAFPDMKMLSQMPVEPGAYYVMDRAYLDFTRLIRLHKGGAKFVVRNKCHVRLVVKASRPVDKSSGLRCDQIVRLKSPWSRNVFACDLRRIRFREPVEGRTLIFLTNDLEVPALTICQLYKRRWEVELFFKWVKQHLRIRKFFGHSKNAIYCQIWIAICAYLLVAIAKKQTHSSRSLYEILQIVSVNPFEQASLAEVLAHLPASPPPAQIQMSLI